MKLEKKFPTIFTCSIRYCSFQLFSCATNEAGDAKPARIQCVGTEAGQPGAWMDLATDAPVPEDLLADIACECDNLRIPEATDTNVFCDSEHQVDNGNYIIETKDQCEMVCDGQVFIPITCSFAEGNILINI